MLTPEELERLEADVEALLAPYVQRRDDPNAEQPSRSRRVRILRYTLPDRSPDR